MIYKVGYIRDVLGNNYLGIKFTESQMSSWLKELYEIVYDNDKFETLISNQARRDRKEGSDYTHHTTIISVMELNKLLKTIGGELQEKIDTIQSLDLSDIEFKGIGKAEKNHDESYFVVISSPTLDEIRSSLGLDPKDFHTTIGFDKKDVFGVRKNETIKKKTKFRRLIDAYYTAYDGSHEWMEKYIGNLDKNLKRIPEDKINIMNITDTIITYKMDHTQIQVGLIDQGNGEELWMVTKCEYDKDEKI